MEQSTPEPEKKEPSKEPTEFVEPVPGHPILKEDWDNMSDDEKQEFREQLRGE